jgi:hypothetical protein
MYFSCGDAAVRQIVNQLDEFQLLKLGCSGVAEIRTIYFSADGSELLWKGKRGTYVVFPIHKVLGVYLDFPPDCIANDSIAQLHQTHCSFLLQFPHRSVTLAARSQHERCVFVAGVLYLLDQAVGASAGRQMWEDIAPLLFQAQTAPQQQLSAHAASTSPTSVSTVADKHLLLSTAQFTQRSSSIRPLPPAPGHTSAALSASASRASLVKEMIMRQRIVCAASDDIVIACRVQLFSDGTVVVLRDAAAHKCECTLQLMRSSFFEVSPSGVESHVWMSEVATSRRRPLLPMRCCSCAAA